MANLENNNFSINNLITMLNSKATGDTQEKGKEAAINSAKKTTPLPILRQGGASEFLIAPIEPDLIFYNKSLFTSSNTWLGVYDYTTYISTSHSVSGDDLNIIVENKDPEVDATIWLHLLIGDIEGTIINNYNKEIVVFCPAASSATTTLKLSDYVSTRLYGVSKTIKGLFYTKAGG